MPSLPQYLHNLPALVKAHRSGDAGAGRQAALPDKDAFPALADLEQSDRTPEADQGERRQRERLKGHGHRDEVAAARERHKAHDRTTEVIEQ